jgi:hypothetical protein
MQLLVGRNTALGVCMTGEDKGAALKRGVRKRFAELPPAICGFEGTNIYNSIPGVQPLDRFAALMRGKLERPSESHAPHLGSLPAFAGTGLDERPLEFGEPSQDRQYNAWTC